MAEDQNLIHPELRRASKLMPQFSFSRGNLWLVRMLFNLQPKVKAPGDVRVEDIKIPGGEGGHTIRLRVYRPKAMAAPAAGLVWMHGGGYLIGRPEMNDPVLLRFAQELDILIVSVDYRWAPEHPFPAPLEDCYTALRWAAENGPAMGIDPGRIAIGGESAGGGLAASLAQLALDRGEARPVFQMLVYPMLDDRTVTRPGLENKGPLTWTRDSNRFGWESYLGQKCGAGEVPRYSAAARREDLSGLPPAWIGVGTLDLFYEEDVAYANQLRDCGVECELVVVPGAFHGFDFFGEWFKVVDDFRKSQVEALRKHLFHR